MRPMLILVLAFACAGATPARAADPPAQLPAAPQEAPLLGAPAVRRDAEAALPLAQTDDARAFLAAAADLPSVAKRTIYYTEDRSAYYSEAQAGKLPPEERARLQSRELDENFYYHTRYGTPAAYMRAIDVLYGLRTAGAIEAADPGAKLDPAPAGIVGARIMDFGAGGMGAARMLASLSADVTCVDVDKALAAYYSEPTDSGLIPLSRAGVQKLGMSGNERIVGKAQLLTGRWPAEPGIRETVAGGYDVILSKNTLKRGYIHPERETEKRFLVDLGVDDAAFLAALHDALKPGGVVVIYNICPAMAKPEEKYIPWADGRSPFSREQWEQAGFRVVAFDVDDSKATRTMARAFAWDKGDRPMNPENDLFAWFTVVQRKP